MSLKSFTDTVTPIIIDHLDQLVRFDHTDPRHSLESAMRHTLFAKSKHFRPLLVCATHQLFSSTIKAILPIACAIELIHTGSLIHDDLPAMDNDTMRRGKPACHIEFGEALSILAGYTLQCYAFEVLSSPTDTYYPSERRIPCLHAISKACGVNGMAGGQVLDLDKTNPINSLETLNRTHQLKTGAIIEACLYVPAKLNNADRVTIKKLTTFGQHIGLLFQITDDILDVTSSKETLGKSPNKDHKQNKLTYVSQWGLDKAKKQAKKQAAIARDCLNSLHYDTTLLNEFVDWVSYRIC